MSSIMMSSAARRAISFRFYRISSIARQQHHFSFHTSSLEKITTCKPSSPLLHPFRFFSSSVAAAVTKPASDIKLAKVIESELQCAQEEEDDADQLTMGMPIRLMDPVSEGGLLPDQFPFKIIDIPGEETITLKREFDGESIEVLVGMPQMEGEDDEEDGDSDDGNDDDKASGQFNMSLLVTVSKGSGPRLEFSCIASPDEVSIDNMLMKGPDESSGQVPYEGPQFMDLDENLQKEFHAYLERRGIKSSLISFLQEYMMKKDSKEYKLWLKSMKEFVEK